jgi:S1-C subfamily serine protease
VQTQARRRATLTSRKLIPRLEALVSTPALHDRRWRRRARIVVPLLAAIVAGAAVAGVSLATGSDSSNSDASSTTTSVPNTGVALQDSYVNVVRAVSPSVVLIEDQVGLGSGIVFDSAGDIVTNHHVVAGGKSFTVTTSAGKRYPAKLVGSFAPDDLAVIKITGAGLKPATFANSSKLRVGDLAIAIGNPLGLQSSVTNGIVSAFRQATPESSNVTLPSLIQTSAAINPGNSGGALADIQGRVIGIPTLAANDPEIGGSAPGIGFALPSNLVTDIARQIVKYGKVVNSHRAYLGIRAGDTTKGVYVGSVTAGGPAAKAGIHVGDVIVSVDGKPTSTTAMLSAVLAELTPSHSVPVVMQSQAGVKTTVQLTLGTYP